MKRTSAVVGSSAFAFVLTMGIVNLFADMTYEGGASINGPFLVFIVAARTGRQPPPSAEEAP